MARHARPTSQPRSPRAVLGGAAVAAVILAASTATATAVAPAGKPTPPVGPAPVVECRTVGPVKPAPSNAPVKPSKPAPGKPPVSSPGTTAPPESPPPVSGTPSQGAGTTAAQLHGWGAPIPEASDDFNGTSLDTAKWSVYDSAGHDGNGRRTPERVTVQDGKLILTGLANGDSAGLASTFDQQYGRWEARVRSSQEDIGGTPLRPLLIVWPTSNLWPDHGEYDFFENPAPGVNHLQAFLHLPGHQPYRQEEARLDGVDTSQWQNIAFEWTPEHLKGYANGVEWFHFDRHNITGMPSGHLTIQLDADVPNGLNPATYEVDWVATYALS
ncbi:glycosyl hydrolase family 16 [Pseudonocardia autotrophica]|uniref:Glycosyl hydrolases family 16 n=3 Tax=Pseudonocardia TaxID=1847 RepID=A0A1Y2N6Y8_PSEAH|nr:glycoside hydrolase family 16 protein [Pseudonocardia autotrophica]OSY42939.1 Glycosyl hydrolases family 16 [Pseudonocardia autotrophica]TDN77515.1 glycosyl hydrolase family 16 [Pseudonocardia autotrophica]BBG01540.1 hypothetical protein Pdca_27490 [Pseudonocardia autotrophica]GEC25324.1 hypothetical protein PSA01_23530 [Pseudonocardia saturnea]